MIELTKPDAKSCNACPSMNATVGIRFMSNEYQAQTIRLCYKCAKELKARLAGVSP